MNRERKEQPSTYFVQDRHNKEELRRLTIQDQMITTGMGGIFPEQPDPATFRRVLDVACGPGGWVIEAAKAYPEMALFGVDISHRMIDYAREQARGQQMRDRVEFQVMDALLILAFPPGYFDLVNIRFASSFVRIWEWAKLINEMIRVTKPGGVVRVTDSGVIQHSSSPALTLFQEMFLCALDRSGHLAEREASGMTTHLAHLLQLHGVRHPQTKTYAILCQAGTAEGAAYRENLSHAFQTLRPFIQKWGCVMTDYEELCQMAQEQMSEPDFSATWDLLTAWGTT